MTRYLVLDLDGTLVDSEKIWDIALQELYAGNLNP